MSHSKQTGIRSVPNTQLRADLNEQLSITRDTRNSMVDLSPPAKSSHLYGLTGSPVTVRPLRRSCTNSSIPSGCLDGRLLALPSSLTTPSWAFISNWCAPPTTPEKMALGNPFYSALFRRTSTFTLTLILGSVFFERWYDSWSDLAWERLNRGVSLAWEANQLRGLYTILPRMNLGCGVHAVYIPVVNTYVLYCFSVLTPT